MGYICNKNIKCADCEHYRRNPDEDRMFCYAEVDEKAEEAKNKAAKAAYVVVNHYSNENISEFDSVSILEKAFFSLDDAIKAANAAFAEDKANGVDHGDTEPITADDCTAWLGCCDLPRRRTQRNQRRDNCRRRFQRWS